MWGIILYYLWILLCLYLCYVLLFCTYTKEYNKDKGEVEETKVVFPLYTYILAVLVAFVPFINFCACIGIVTYMSYISDKEDAYFKTFLFKKR